MASQTSDLVPGAGPNPQSIPILPYLSPIPKMAVRGKGSLKLKGIGNIDSSLNTQRIYKQPQNDNKTYHKNKTKGDEPDEQPNNNINSQILKRKSLDRSSRAELNEVLKKSTDRLPDFNLRTNNVQLPHYDPKKDRHLIFFFEKPNTRKLIEQLQKRTRRRKNKQPNQQGKTIRSLEGREKSPLLRGAITERHRDSKSNNIGTTEQKEIEEKPLEDSYVYENNQEAIKNHKPDQISQKSTNKLHMKSANKTGVLKPLSSRAAVPPLMASAVATENVRQASVSPKPIQPLRTSIQLRTSSQSKNPVTDRKAPAVSHEEMAEFIKRWRQKVAGGNDQAK